ncbi:polysaccharide biosynthesis tyrosine autokinase [Marinilabiliaceae bacterium ANBcel2]|nr:polysaccharide biosynthesis tyrosine autokinase [Marinilabiliaceae bacterium ANBcel2]
MAIPVNNRRASQSGFTGGDSFSDIKKLVRLVVKNWYLFILFVPLCIAGAWLYHRYTTPQYRASVTMMFKVESNRAISQSVLTEGFGLSPEMRRFENQSFIIRSQAMARRAVDRLDFAVSYYSKGRMRDSELYDPVPFVVEFDSLHPQLLNTPIYFDFKADGSAKISVTTENAPLHIYADSSNDGYSGDVNISANLKPGEKIDHHALSFSYRAPDNRDLPDAGNYYVVFRSHNSIASQFRSSLSVNNYREGSSIIFISTTGNQPRKLVKFLNVFSQVIVENNLERKNDMASRSIDFIQRQLHQVADTLEITQQQLMDFRRENRFIAPTEMSQKLSAEFFELEKNRRELESAKKYLTTINSRLRENSLDKNDYMLPAFSAEPAAIVQEYVKEHLSLLNEYSLISSQSGGSDNPYLLELKKRIELSKNSLISSISKQIENIDMMLAENRENVAILNSQIEGLPEMERDYLALQRTHDLNDAIYTFLLQKSSEMQIAKASNVPDNEVLDNARVGGPISPDTRGNYMKALILGLVIPSIIIALKEFMNNRIRGREDIEAVFNDIPLVGQIMRNRAQEENVVFNDPGSVIAESFRSLRVRLRFLLTQNQGRVISVTSSNTGEGKTFCSVNLASVYAISGKKTAIVGFDLRKPRLSDMFNIVDRAGISNYLINQASYEEIIYNSGLENLYVVPAGVIPPNPSELISGEKAVELIDKLKKDFEIIIIDTPPVGLVSDGRILMELSHCHLFVVRAGVTIKDHFSLTVSSLIAEDVGCMGLILNDVSEAQSGYGYYTSGYFK